MGFIVGLGGENEYKIGKVKYIVSSSFLPTKEKVDLKERLARVVASDFTDWTDVLNPIPTRTLFININNA